MNLPDEVYSLALEQTANGLVCPFCNGGTNRDRSFSCTRVAGGFVYICFRGKCGKKGFVPDRGVWGSFRNVENRKPVKVFDRPTEQLPQEVREYLNSRYGITEETIKHFGIRWAPPQEARVGRVIIPVIRPSGISDGCVARTIQPSSEPKALTYIERGGVLSWFRVSPEREQRVWVVEDQFSAIRLWQEDITAVALLGTGMNHGQAIEISSVSRDVFIALDKDATAKAIQHATQYRYAFNAKVVALSKDVKDMAREELKEFLSETNR